MKKLIILFSLLIMISCGKDKTGELVGRFEVIETKCTAQETIRRVMDFTPMDHRINVRVLESSAQNFYPYNFEADYRKISNNEFELNSQINTSLGLVAYTIRGKFNDEKNFTGTWVEIVVNSNSQIKCDIKGRRID